MKYSGKSTPQGNVWTPRCTLTRHTVSPLLMVKGGAVNHSTLKAFLFQGQWGRYLWEGLWPCTNPWFPLHLLILASTDSLPRCLRGCQVAILQILSFLLHLLADTFLEQSAFPQLLLLKEQGQNAFLYMTEKGACLRFAYNGGNKLKPHSLFLYWLDTDFCLFKCCRVCYSHSAGSSKYPKSGQGESLQGSFWDH